MGKLTDFENKKQQNDSNLVKAELMNKIGKQAPNTIYGRRVMPKVRRLQDRKEVKL